MTSDFHPNSWINFIDSWAQYHRVSMSEEARAALCNAFSGLTPEEVKVLQETPVAERFLTPDDIIVNSEETSMGMPRRIVRAERVTEVIKGVPAATRIVRRTPPAATVPTAPPRTARIMRTPRKE